MKTIKSSIILLCLATLAFAQTPPPPTPAPTPTPAETEQLKLKSDLSESQERVTYLTKLCNGIEQQRNAAEGRAGNAALQLSIASEMVADYKQKLADLQSRYDLEKAKVEVMLKEKGGNSAVEAKKK